MVERARKNRISRCDLDAHSSARLERARQDLAGSIMLMTRTLSIAFSYAVTTGVCVAASSFEPYQMNGGILAACAGPDYCILASDTRLMGEGGYEIISRKHTSSRLWTVSDNNQPSALWESDGSLRVLDATENAAPNEHGIAVEASPLVHMAQTRVLETPIMVGSAGCSADCEMLKRTLRNEVRSMAVDVHPHVLAVLLSQTLYERRTFPFYSFCVLVGLSRKDGGHVYVYDAIGSYERVAVATAGQSRDLLQPILDRKFASVDGDKRAASAHHVHCSKDVALAILVDAYRSVSERHIDVGDNIVFCVISSDGDGQVQVESHCTALKKH